MMDQWILSGFVNYNFGSVREETEVANQYEKAVTISGLGANLRAAYRHGQTENDLISVDLIYSTGDENGIADEKYNGVITGNTWGTPAGVFISSGSYILFPHGNVVNRFNAAVTDISNLGYGLQGGTINIAKDIIPHQLNGKVGFAMAQSAFEPRGGGKMLGSEINAMISYSFGPFMSLELHAAHMWLGDFYESQRIRADDITSKPEDPWLAFAAFKWLMF